MRGASVLGPLIAPAAAAIVTALCLGYDCFKKGRILSQVCEKIIPVDFELVLMAHHMFAINRALFNSSATVWIFISSMHSLT